MPCVIWDSEKPTKDLVIFHAAREADAAVMRKDGDFVLLLERFGPPLQVPWVTRGNTSNARCEKSCSRAFRKPEPVWSRASRSSKSVMRARKAREQREMVVSTRPHLTRRWR